MHPLLDSFTKTKYHTNGRIPAENFRHNKKAVFGKFLTWCVYGLQIRYQCSQDWVIAIFKDF